MALAHSPRIVTNGLISYIDAINPKSYPGSGTTMFDLSGNGKNGTSGGGLTYSTENGGRFDFNGINSVITFGDGNTFSPLSEFTIEVWFRSTGTTPTTGTLPGIFGGTYGMRLFVNSTNLNYRLNEQLLASTKSISTPSSFDFYNGGWNCVTCQGSSSNSLMRIYLNGVLQNETSVAWTGTTQWPTNSFNFGRDNNDSNYFFAGSMSSIRMYNTFLTNSQISENFNALRGRYGL